MTLDYLAHLAADSDRFATVIARAPQDRPVPSCPDWTAADLWFHLAEVQWFWARIVGGRLTETAGVEALPAPEPTDDPGAFFARATAALRRALAETPPETPAWSWAEEQTAGFSYRRQAHEALIHRVDAELVAEDRTPLDPALAADGVTEALTVMYGDPPRDWGEFRPDPARVIEFAATDTGDRWRTVVGRFTGTSRSGEQHDLQTLDVAGPDAEPSARITGAAADLDCWLWHRPPLGEVITDGDPATLAAFQVVIRDGLD
ncbi:maleylpyruvate isomerase N-terminal domain-containing protein [Microlunatus speluncae]|uniref:maleylpyruvate isomerase N-terminal domain-containing protein n=1 Tax=Microlunatus speluncae TaxID=2594267 RepID=UPI00126630AB|nr:maleylpyruvate isomerase N-terminal domain-containing protein [Microlunatus speluncae]